MMKKILFIPLIIMAFSGCVLQQVPFTKVLQEDGNTYQQNDIINGFTFQLPDTIEAPYGILLEVYIVLPDSTSTGLYSKTFYPPYNEFFIDLYTVLYYPGFWAVNYCFTDVHNETVLLEGSGSIFVESDDTDLSRFELISWDCPAEVNYSESFYVSFSIKNTGVEPGRLNMWLSKTEFTETTTIFAVGNEIWNKSTIIDDDVVFSEDFYIFSPESDFEIVLRYNEEEYRQLVSIIGGSRPEVNEMPFDLLLGFVIAVILIGVFLWLKR